MGCGASSDGANNNKGSPTLKYNKAHNINSGRRGTESDSDLEGGATGGPRTSPSVSSRASIVSNNFTTTYTTNSKNPHRSTTKSISGGTVHEAYRPGASAADADAQFESWRNRNKGGSGGSGGGGGGIFDTPYRGEEKLVVDEFVFGDFKVDPSDVNRQRIERLNRVRTTTGPRRGNSSRDLSLQARRGSAGGTFVMNDFAVKTVDEVDDPIYHYLHEAKVPHGFFPLQRFTTCPMKSHPTRVKVLAISPSESEFVGASIDDDNLSMYGMASGDETTCFVGHAGPIVSASFSRDGKYIATSSRDNTVMVWDTMHKDNARRLIRTLEHSCLPICIDFNCDGKYLVTGCQDKVVRVWHVETTEQIQSFCEHQGVIVCLALHGRDPEVAVSGGGDRTLRKWNILTAECTQRFIGHDGIVISAAFTPDGDRILSNDDRAVKMWNSETGACILNVTLQSLLTTTIPTSSDFPPPMPLPRSFLDRQPLTSKQLGYAPNGIVGDVALNACKIAATKSVFTISCLLPGLLSQSYFAVACTNKMIFIVSCATGLEAASIATKAAVFALAPGRSEKLIYGDVFGNVGLITVVAKQQ